MPFHGFNGSCTGLRPKVFSPNSLHVRSMKRLEDHNVRESCTIVDFLKSATGLPYKETINHSESTHLTAQSELECAPDDGIRFV